MKQITNKTIITVTLKAPFITWIQSTDEGSADIKAENITSSPNAYMVDDTEDGLEPDKLIKKNFKAIFEEELNGWIIDVSMWPPKWDLQTFHKWFQVTVHSQIFYIGKQPFLMEEWRHI